MIKRKIEEAVNNQIQAEFQSAYNYLAASAWFEEKSLNGFASWLKAQWEEEIGHAMKFYNHLIQRDGRPVLQNIDKPAAHFDSPRKAFEIALEQERSITKRIHKMYGMAKKEGDYPLESLLLWFIDEQVEEEDAVQEIIDKLELIGDNGSGLYLLDREMSERQSGTDQDAVE